MDNRHYILDGKIPIPVDLLVWARWLEEHRADRIIKQETVGNCWVSTVFLGLNHNYLDDGPPLLFETMVFAEKDSKRDYNDLYMDRYSTWELALEGHEKAVAWAKEHQDA